MTTRDTPEMRKALNDLILKTFGLSYAEAGLAWEYGTIVRHRERAFPNAMILTDDGVLVQVLTLPRGDIVRTGRSIWEPDTP